MPDFFDTFQCAACGNPITAKLPDPSEIIFLNAPQLSVIALSHETPLVCSHCSVKYHMVVAGVIPKIAWKILEDKKEESRIIVPTLGMPPHPRGNGH